MNYESINLNCLILVAFKVIAYKWETQAYGALITLKATKSHEKLLCLYTFEWVIMEVKLGYTMAVKQPAQPVAKHTCPQWFVKKEQKIWLTTNFQSKEKCGRINKKKSYWLIQTDDYCK